MDGPAAHRVLKRQQVRPVAYVTVRFFSASSKVTAFGTVGWRHAFGNTQPGSTLSFASGGAPFSAVGVPVARDAAVLEVGVDAAVTKNLSLGLSYSGQIGGSFSDHALYGNLLWKF